MDCSEHQGMYERREHRSYAAEMSEVSGAVDKLRERPELISNKVDAVRSSSDGI